MEKQIIPNFIYFLKCTRIFRSDSCVTCDLTDTRQWCDQNKQRNLQFSLQLVTHFRSSEVELGDTRVTPPVLDQAILSSTPRHCDDAVLADLTSLVLAESQSFDVTVFGHFLELKGVYVKRCNVPEEAFGTIFVFLASQDCDFSLVQWHEGDSVAK